VDDAMTRIDQRFDAVDQRFDRVDRSFDRVWDEFRELRGQIAATNRQMAQIGWGMVGILFVQLIAAIIAFS
jgi:tetrahydromethanopterin S-methyltransferase subunit G